MLIKSTKEKINLVETMKSFCFEIKITTLRTITKNKNTVFIKYLNSNANFFSEDSITIVYIS